MVKLRPTRRLIFLKLIIYLFLFLSSGTILSDNIFSQDLQFDFAHQLYKNNDYYRSISEFERYVFFNPNGDKTDSAKFYIGLCFYKGGKKPDAIDQWDKCLESIKDTNYKKNTLGFLTLTYFDLKKLIAVKEIIESEAIVNFSTRQINVINMWKSILENNFENAVNKCDVLLSEKNDNIYNEIKTILKSLNIKKKSPLLAGICAIVPGGGYLYLGRAGDSAFIFIVNSFLGYLTYDGINNKNSFTTGLWGTTGSLWYGSSIFGSIRDAKKFNKNNTNIFVEKIKSAYLNMTFQKENIISVE